MNTYKILRSFLAIAVFFFGPLSAGRKLVDEIVAQVNKVNIHRSDLNEPQVQLKGKTRSVEQCIAEELLYQKAKSYNAIMSEEDLDKRLSALREGYGFGYRSQGEFESFLRKEGLTSKRIKEQIKRTGAVASIENALMPRDALVSRQDIEKYCAQHPKEKEEEYFVSFAVISKDDLNLLGEVPDDIELSWTELDGWMSKSSLGASMKFIADMKIGEVSKPVFRDSDCFFYRLDKKAEKRPFSVEERYAEVENLLVGACKAEKEREIKQRLRDEASVVVLVQK
jgi:hypothetical protein